MAAYNPYSTARLKKNLPEIQAALRKAQKLRKQQGTFEAMRDKEFSPGGVMESGRGAFYDVPDFYVPNYSGMADKIVGGLGGYLTDKMGDKAEDELNALRNPEIIDAVQQMGYTKEDVAALMQQSLGLPPEEQGPASAAASGAAPPMGPEAPLPPGVPQVPGAGGMTPPYSPMGPRPQMGGMGDMQNPQMPPAGSTASAAGSPAGGQQQGISLNDLPLNDQQKMELQNTVRTLDQLGVSDDVIHEVVMRAQEAAKLPPGQKLGKGGSISVTEAPPEVAPGGAPGGAVAQELSQTLGLGSGPLMAPDGSPIANDETLRAYLGMIGGPDLKDVIGKTPHVSSKSVIKDTGEIVLHMSDGTTRHTGERAVWNGKQFEDPGTGRVLTTTEAGTLKEMQLEGAGAPLPAGGMPPGVAPPSGTTLVPGAPPPAGRASVPGRGPLTPAAEVEAAKEQAKANALAEVAPAVMTKEEAEKLGSLTAENRAAAIAALPKAQQTLDTVKRHVGNLLKNPKLPKIVGKNLPGRLSALPGGQMLNNAWLGAVRAEGDEGANFITQLDQITNEAFLQGYEDSMKGTGPVSNIEGLKTAAAKVRSSMTQGEDAFRAALNEFVTEWEKTVNRMSSVRDAPAPSVSAPAPTNNRRDALRSKYGL